MNNLKLLRKRKGMLQDDVAKYLGLTRPAYSHYETGKRVPDGEMLEKLADLFEVTIDELMGRSPAEDAGRHLEEVPELVPEDEVMIPLVASLRCGPGHSGEPFTYIKPIPVPASYIRRWGEGLQAIIAVGESMSPTIIPGDMLICRPGDEWVNGNVVSVNLDDTDMIKRIYETRDGVDLRSDNPNFAPIHISDADISSGRLHVLGRVLLPIGREL